MFCFQEQINDLIPLGQAVCGPAPCVQVQPPCHRHLPAETATLSQTPIIIITSLLLIIITIKIIIILSR